MNRTNRTNRLNRLNRIRRGLAFACALALLGSACAGDDACTEIGCDSVATITYNGFSVPGPYDLSVELDGTRVNLRCNDPGSMEELENPEDVTCSGGGFEIVGERANQTSTIVTIYDIENDEAIIVNQPVQLAVGPNGALEPNGPDCPPVCYERFGSVLP